MIELYLIALVFGLWVFWFEKSLGIGNPVVNFALAVLPAFNVIAMGIFLWEYFVERKYDRK
jgi:hypothetical protein